MLAAGLAMTTAVGGAEPAQDTHLPQTPGWELVPDSSRVTLTRGS